MIDIPRPCAGVNSLRSRALRAGGRLTRVGRSNRLFGCLISPILRRRRLLLYPQNRVLRRLRSEFHDCLSWNLDFLLCLGINPGARFSLLLHKLAKTGQDKFAVLFDRFVSEVAERI
jgi:hypothetical protein